MEEKLIYKNLFIERTPLNAFQQSQTSHVSVYICVNSTCEELHFAIHQSYDNKVT